MGPPLAGRPPFATDQPDSVFAGQPKPTPRPRKQNVDTTALGGARESAYTAFDSYFTSGNGPDSRASGVGDIGRGLMNAGSDDDDSSDDESPKKQPQPANYQPTDKHVALYDAAAGGSVVNAPPPSYEGDRSVISQQRQHSPASLPSLSNVRTVKQPQAVMHARTNDWHVSQHIEPSTPPATPRSIAQQQQHLPPNLQAGVRPHAVPSRHLHPPQPLSIQTQHYATHQHAPPSPNSQYFNGAIPVSPTNRTPQPLPPPQTPITPVFARPRKVSTIKFEEKGEILRGNSEETLLARGTGGKGDDFWRRFSMVAKVEARGGSKKSAWLKKSENGSTRLSTWVWILGILLLVAIGGGIGVGWYFTHNKPASQPVAIGGSADEGFTSTSTTMAASTSVKPTKVTAAPEPTTTSNPNRRDAAPIVPPAHRRTQTNRTKH